MTPADAHLRSLGERLGWGVLGGLLLLLLLTAATTDRPNWPSFMGDEATYLMAAESVAWDFDLEYERQDYERFTRHWQQPPEGLILQSGDGGASLTFGKPFFYSVFLAPFVRWSPTSGPLVANVLLLAAAAWLTARTLERRVGAAAPWWTALFLFGSVAFSYSFWAHADLFLMSLTAIALALSFSDPESADRPLPVARRFLLAGAALAMVAFSRPIYAPIFLPALLAAPRGRRPAAWLGLALGALLLAGGSVAVHQATASAWTSYGGERGGFYSWTGFPEIDFPAESWDEAIHASGNVAWGGWLLGEARSTFLAPERIRLWLQNTLYFFTGRHVGVLVYYLPLVLGLLAAPRRWAHWSLPLAVAISIGALLAVRPFNFYGGGAAIANRYFLPLYPAFWFTAGRRGRGWWALPIAFVAAVLMWPTWRQLDAYPRTAGLTYRYVAPLADRWLPYETTQSHLKPSGQEDTLHNGLWVKLLTPAIRSQEQGTFALPPGRRGELILGSEAELETIRLSTVGERAARLEVDNARLRSPAGGAASSWRIAFDRPTAVHPMWWTWEPLFLYRLELRFESDDSSAIRFTLHPGAGTSAEPLAPEAPGP